MCRPFEQKRRKREGKKTLELKCEGTFVAFKNGAGAAGTARQIQNPSG
jgi:hypothetical protein